MLLILNPCSGIKQGPRKLSDIISVFQSGGYICTAMVTDGRCAASDYVRLYGGDADIITCIGGDGTYNEVLSGVLDCGLDVPIGYIPAGSTNDFASSLHLSTDLLTAAQDIVDGTVYELDAGSMCGRRFSYVASFGAFSRTSYATPQSFKNTFGHLAYIMSGAKELLQIHPEHLRFETDAGCFEGDYIFGAVCSTTSMGGVLSLDPGIVDLSDGKFELLLIRRPNSVNELIQITNALTRRQYDCDMIDFAQISRADILCEHGIDWSLDGEYFSAPAEAHVENLHRAVKLKLSPSEDAESEEAV